MNTEKTMKRFSDKDVKSAADYMKELIGRMKGAMILSQDQIDCLVEINRETDPIVRADKTVAMSQKLVKEAELHLVRHKDDLRALGIDPDRKFGGDRFSNAGRATFDEANEEFAKAMSEEIEAEVSRVMAQTTSPETRLPEKELAWA